MVNFGYPYNDIVICKDSTDYLLGKLIMLHHVVVVVVDPLLPDYWGESASVV